MQHNLAEAPSETTVKSIEVFTQIALLVNQPTDISPAFPSRHDSRGEEMSVRAVPRPVRKIVPRPHTGRAPVERLAILDAYVAADSDKERRAILKRHKATAANMASWAVALYGKRLRDLYGNAVSILPPSRRRPGKETLPELRREVDILRRLVALAWRQGAYDSFLQSLNN